MITPVVLQPLQLLPGLHPLCNHTQFHPAGQAYDEGQDALGSRPGNLRLDELHIQLQYVDWHFREHIQRGITAAEIVHLDDKAKLPQVAQRLEQLF